MNGASDLRTQRTIARTQCEEYIAMSSTDALYELLGFILIRRESKEFTKTGQQSVERKNGKQQET